MKKKNNKDIRTNTKEPASKISLLFYIIGIIFFIATVAYFAHEYIFDLSRTVKTIILLCLIVIFYFCGDFLRERDW